MRPDTYGRIAERAQNQLGLITYPELDSIGVTRHERAGLISSRRWERRGRRVLADAASPRTPWQDLLAAALDVPGSVVAGPAAAWLVDLRGFRPAPVHLLVKRGGNHRPVGSVLHETFWLPPSHTQVVHGVPCVSDARLAFELAWGMHPMRLRRIIDWLMSNRGMTAEALATTTAAICRRGKPGSAEMRLVVEERSPGYVPPASELEVVYRDVCDAFGLPHGVRQKNAGGEAWIGRVDVTYPKHKLLVELDSRRWHDTSTAFDDDRRRTNDLVRAGWRVIRITWRMLHDEPEKVVALLRSCLGGASAA